MLIDNGANLDVKDIHGRTPLHQFAANVEFRWKLFEYYLESGCNVNVQDNDGKTPLHFACCHNNIRAVQELLRYGADLNIEDCSGKIALCYLFNPELISTHDAYDLRRLHLFVQNHIKKMTAAGFSFSDRVLSAFSRGVQCYKSLYPGFLDGMEDSLAQYEAEVEKMKNIKINKYSSLYDMLFEDEQELSKHSKNSNFSEIMECDRLKKDFPYYGFLLKLQFKRGLRRSMLMEPARNTIKSIVDLNLPDLCFDYIFRHLNNDDIKNLIETIKAPDRDKRKVIKMQMHNTKNEGSPFMYGSFLWH